MATQVVLCKFLLEGSRRGGDSGGKKCIENPRGNVNISNYVTIAPGTHINGNIKIGNNTEVGSGTTTVQNVTIGKNCIIGTGTVLIDSIPDNSTVVGNPGKIIKLKSKSQKSKKSELKKIVKKQITY